MAVFGTSWPVLGPSKAFVILIFRQSDFVLRRFGTEELSAKTPSPHKFVFDFRGDVNRTRQSRVALKKARVARSGGISNARFSFVHARGRDVHPFYQSFRSPRIAPVGLRNGHFGTLHAYSGIPTSLRLHLGSRRPVIAATLLTRLVALNHECAAEEKRGLIRYLRPEYQRGGDHRSPSPPEASIQQNLTGTETSEHSKSNISPGVARKAARPSRRLERNRLNYAEEPQSSTGLKRAG
jgi:hypothetical protein